MSNFDYRHWSRHVSDWVSTYRETIGLRRVRSPIVAGDILSQLSDSPPEVGESMESIFSDFERIIPDGMTHWQHPRFFGYFPSNSADAACIGDQLASGLSAQCMLWQTSPAATELEIRMVDWLRQAVGLPDSFKGSFQDTASHSTLCSILVMRERALKFTGNSEGLFNKPVLRIYASEQNHSSIEKALWISGLGSANLVKIPSSPDSPYSLDTEYLQRAITEDRSQGFCPAGIVGCVGGTSIGAIDNIESLCDIAEQENLYIHIDAAWAGTAMICPEFRDLWQGIERADSIVLNPHKWLGVPFECSLHLVRDASELTRTLAISPTYLQNPNGVENINFSEWSTTLGRGFRSLKVWFLLRNYGLDGLRDRIRNHIAWSRELSERLSNEEDFEIVTPPILSLFSFRHLPESGDIDAHNLSLVDRINADGRIYLTQTTHNGSTIIRFVAGQFEMSHTDIRHSL